MYLLRGLTVPERRELDQRWSIWAHRQQVAPLGEDGIGYVLADASVAGASRAGWAAAVADCARAWGADRVVAEPYLPGVDLLTRVGLP